jgi:peptide/nickel transport system substrate-binding protein
MTDYAATMRDFRLEVPARFNWAFDTFDAWGRDPSKLALLWVSAWRAAGIRTRVRPMERAGFFSQFREKKLRGVLLAFIGVHGNAATRLDAFVAAGGVYTYGSYPDIEGLIKEQRNELDRKKREAMLHKIQQLVHEKAMFAPIWELAFMNGHGPRLAESGLGLIGDYFYSAPYEDVRLKGQ